VAEGGKEFFDPGAVAGGACDLLIAEDQDLKVLVAFHTVIFKDRHADDLRIYCKYNTPEDLFPDPLNIFSSAPSMI
jgi:hypothetical protein